MNRYKSHFIATAKATVLLLTSLCAITARAVTSQEIEQALVKIEHDRNEYETCAKQWITKMDERKQRVDIINGVFLRALQNLANPNSAKFGYMLKEYTIKPGCYFADGDGKSDLKMWLTQLDNSMCSMLDLYEQWTDEGHDTTELSAQYKKFSRDTLLEMQQTIDEDITQNVNGLLADATDFGDVKKLWRYCAELVTLEGVEVVIPRRLTTYVLEYFPPVTDIVWQSKIFFDKQDPVLLQELASSTEENITLTVKYPASRDSLIAMAQVTGSILYSEALKLLGKRNSNNNASNHS